VLPLADWTALAERLTAAGTKFVIAPTVRFAGEPGEQHTIFFVDPFGNPLEIKGFRNMDAVYAT
jgi:extradiol dioxygenase family protein